MPRPLTGPSSNDVMLCVEFLPLGPELICHDVTNLLQVGKTFLQGINSSATYINVSRC